jgi:hypothetical protein
MSEYSVKDAPTASENLPTSMDIAPAELITPTPQTQNNLESLESQLPTLNNGQSKVVFQNQAEPEDAYMHVGSKRLTFVGWTVMILLLVSSTGFGLAGVMSSRNNKQAQGPSVSKLDDSKSLSADNSNQTLHINFETLIGKNLSANGAVLIQNDLTDGLQVQNSAGDDLLVVDTSNGKVGVGKSPVSTDSARLQVDGDISTNGALVSTTGNYSLSNSGLTLDGVLICTSAGCKSTTEQTLNLNGVAFLSGNQTFTGVNKFTSSGNIFVGDGSGLSTLNAGNISSGTLSDARLGGNIPRLNGNQSFTGSNTFTNQLQADSGINVNSAYSVSGVGGSTFSCAPGELLQQPVINGGIITGGSCITIAGGTTPTFQEVYNASNPAALTLSSTNGGLNIKDALVPLGSNLFAVSNNAQSITYFAVNSAGITATGNVNTTAQYQVNGVQISSADLLDSTNLAKLNANQTFTGNNSIHLNSTAFTVQDAVSPLGANLFEVTDSSGSSKYFSVSAAGAKVNGNDVCTTVGNCAGVGGGVTTAGGTTNKLAKFTAAQGIGDSIITDNGSTVSIAGTLSVNTIIPTATMTVGTSTQTLTLQGDGSTKLTATAGGFTNSLVFATPAVGNHTITIPNATGTVAVSASGPLALDAAGNLSCPTCLTSAGGVTSLNSLTGALTLAGTANQVIITPSGNTLTFSLPQDIATSSSPTFTNINVTGQYRVNGSQISSTNLSNDANLAKLNGTQSFTGANTFSNASNSFTGDGSGLTSLNASNVSSGTLNDARLTANVTVQGNTFNGASQLVQLTGGGLLPVLNGSNLTTLNATNISSGTLSDARLSSNVPLKNAANTFTNTNLFKANSTAELQVQNASGNEVLTVDTTNGLVALGKSASVSGDLLFYNATGSGSIALQTANPGSSAFTILLPADNGTVCLTSGNCVGVGGSGDILNNGNSFGADVTLGTNDSNNFKLETNNQTQATIAPGGATTFRNSANSTAAFQIQNSAGTSNLFIADTTNNRIAIGQASATYKLDVAGDINSTTGFRVAGTAGSSVTCSSGNVLQNAVISGGIITGGTCVTNGGGLGTSLNLQNIYDNSNPASLTLNSTNGGLTILDNATPLGANLFAVKNSTGATTYFAVTSSGLSVTGDVNITGLYKVNGVQISSADLSNDANLAKLNANQTFSGNNTFSSASNSFTGDGSGLTSLNATNISSGTLSDARLSSNVPLKNAANTFINTNAFQVTSAAALQVQNASAADTLLTVDSSARSGSGGNRVKIGNSTGTDGNTTILVVDGASADPSSNLGALNGGLFYNSNTNKLSIIENGVVKVLCNTTDAGCGSASTPTLAQVYSYGASQADSTLSLDSTRLGLLIRDNATPLGSTLFGVQNSSGATKYLDVTASAVAVDANFTVTGTINTNTFSSTALTFGGAGAASVNAASGQDLSLGTGASNHTTTLGSTNGTSTTVVQSGSGGITLGSNTSASARLDITGSLAAKKGSDFSTTGTSNNVNFGDASLVRLTGASAQTITGIANGRDGYILNVINAGANAATISNNSGSSLAANRIITGSGADFSLTSGNSVQLIYDSGASLWRINTSGSGVSAVGTIDSQTKSADGAVIVGNSLILQTADASFPGLVSTGTQTWAGAKTFTSLLTGSAGLTVTGGAISLTGNTNSSLTTTSGTLSLQGFSTTSLSTANRAGAATSDVNITSGNVTSGVFASGNISIDVGSSTGTKGTVSIGNGNASAVVLGNVSGSSQTFIQSGSGGISLTGNTTVAGTSTFTVNGGNTSLGADLDVTSSVAFKKGSDFSTTGTSNNVNFGDVSLVRLTGASTQTITGIANGRDGYHLTLINAASQAAVINNNDSGSIAANRITTGTGANISLPAGSSITLVYDSVSALWRTSGDAAGGSGSGVTSVGTFTSCTSYANGAQISSGTITFSCADATNPGMVSTGAQTWAGDKTLTGTFVVNPSTAGAAITLGATNETGTITLGQSTATNTISIGAASGGSATQTINIGTSSTASSTTNVNIGSSIAGTTAITGPTTVTNRTSGSSDTFVANNSTSTGNIAVFKDNGTAVATIADGGATTFRNQTDSAAGFNVQNAAGTAILSTDTTNKYIGINNSAPNAALDVNAAGATFFDGFESGLLSPFSTTTSGGGNAWTASSTDPRSGTFHARAVDDQTNGRRSDLTLIRTLSAPGTVSFYWKNTTGTDGSVGAVFKIDGVTQTGCGLGFSGCSSYTLYSTAVSSGAHTFLWEVQVNSAAPFGADFRLDDVTVTNAGTATSATFNGGNLGIGTYFPNATLEVSGTALFGGTSNSTTAFQVQNSAGNNYLAVDTSGASISVGNTSIASTIQVGNTTGAVTQTINIGNNSTGSSTNNVNIGSSIAGTTAITGPTTVTNRTSGSSDTFVVSNSTSTGTIAKFNDNSTTVFSLADGGAALFANTTNSTAAFQIQNSSGSNGNLFLANTVNVNLIANPSAETNATGWAITTGSGTAPASTTAQALYGNAALSINTSATSTAGAKYDTASLLSATTTYSLSFWAKIAAGSFTVQAGRSDTDVFGGETTCTLSSTTVSTSWTRFTCSFTTGGSITTGGYIFIRQSDSTSRTWFVDGVQLEVAATATNYREGSLQFNGTITSPTVFQNQADSTAAFQVQNSAGNTYLLVNTSGASVSVGDTGIASTVQVGNTTGAVTQTINIGNNSTGSSTNNINIGSSIAGTTAITGPTTVTNRTSGSSDTFVASNSTSTGNIAVFKDNSTAVATIADGGAATFRNQTDSAAGFNIQNAAGTAILSTDTTNRYIGLNNTSPNASLDVNATGALFFDGFESSLLSPFTSTSDDTTNLWAVSAGGHTGSFSAQAGIPAAKTNFNTFLNLTRTSNAPGTFSFWWQCSGGGNFSHFSITIDGSNTDLATNVGGCNGGPNSGTFSTAVGSGTHTYSWKALHGPNASASTSFLVDDVSITNSGTATAALFNAGQVGIGTYFPNATLEVSGTSILGTATNSTTAFQVQNSSGVNGNLLLANTVNPNLIANPSAETNATGWAITTGSGTAPATSTAQALYGNAALSINTSATSTAGAKYDTTSLLSSTTTYSLSFWAKIASGSFTVQAGRSDTDAFGGETTCTLSSTTVSTTWNRYTCTFTTSTVTTGGYIFIRQSDSTSRTWFIDGVQLEAASAPTNYREGSLQFNGTITSPTIFQNQADSPSAFQIQNALSSNTLSADTTALNTLLSNTSFEGSDVSSWVYLGTPGSVARDTTQQYLGNASLKVITTANASNGVKYVTGASGLAISSTYTISWYDKLDSGSAALADIRAVYARNGSAESACTSQNTQTVVKNAWTYHYCTITTDGTTPAAGAYIAIEQTAGAAHTFYVDAVQVALSSSAVAYKETGINLQGTVTSNTIFSGLLTLQPSAALLDGQSEVQQIFTNGSSTGGTVNGYAQNITVSNTSSASTTNGINIAITDATTLANSSNGINIVISDNGASGAKTNKAVVGTSGGSNTSAINYGGYFSISGGASTSAALYASNSTVAANILQLQDNTTDVLTVADGGATTFKNQTNSASAFQVQNANADPLLSINTTSSIITFAGTTTTFINVTFNNAHVKSSQTNAPTIGTPTNCGTTPTAAVTASSTDSAGSFSITNDTSNGTTCDTVVTFNKAYGAAPKSVIITSKDANSALVNAYVSATSTTTFTVMFATPPTANPTTFNFYYWIVE